ncbi:MAG: DUF368 domain-containing protein [Clostridia bacterium]|nr:DUF368 domain-containing protein [Clostridia bacterium]
MKVKDFLINTARGAVIGVAMIIPGVSGGTLAVLMNVYDKLINAISDLRRDFKNCVMFLLPIILGAVIGIGAMYYPLKFALKYAPFPTVMLFIGLMAGSCPKIFKDAVKSGFNKVHIASILIPLAVVIGICFIPGLGEADLSVNMPVYGYFVLLLVGAVASCALVIPGVSGSMLLLIFGYYNAIFDTISGLKTDFGHSILVLLVFAVGLVIGFFSIAKLMKLFMKKFPKGTAWAIIGFVIGSLPAILITYNGNFPEHTFATLDAVQISVGVILGVAGIIASYALTAVLESKTNQRDVASTNLENQSLD